MEASLTLQSAVVEKVVVRLLEQLATTATNGAASNQTSSPEC